MLVIELLMFPARATGMCEVMHQCASHFVTSPLSGADAPSLN